MSPRGNPKGTNRGGGKRPTGHAGKRESFYLAPDLVGKMPTQNKSEFINAAIRAALRNSTTNRDNMIVEDKPMETKYFYCKACGSIWYEDADGNHLFFAWVQDAPAEIVEAAEEKYCGCND